MSEYAYVRSKEVQDLLEEDDTALGNVWRYTQEGLTPKEMAERDGLSTLGWVSNYKSLIAVLLQGHIPDSPSLALAGARRIRSWLKAKNLSNELREALTEQESLLMSRAEDREAQVEEVSTAVRASKEAEATGTPGIYVYTLPHYLRYPIDLKTGRTLLKVGHSSTDAYYRAGSQGRLTALPEDPILLRIYPVTDSAQAEKSFHQWLKDADHIGTRTIRGGSEWFVTSTKFLDHIAVSKGLEIIVVNELEISED